MYGSRVSRAIQVNELHPLLHLTVVAIWKEAFGSLSTTVGQPIYIYNINNEIFYVYK